MEELLRVERDGASNSSSSQANEVKELRRDKERTSSKGLRDEGVKGLRKKERISGMEGVKGLRKNFLTQSTQSTQRSERIKEFLFMGEIVTGGVGQMRTDGPRGQVKGGRWKEGLRD